MISRLSSQYICIIMVNEKRRTMNRLIILDVEMSYGNNHEMIHPVVLCDDKNTVLVDCGYVGALPKIEEALLSNQISPEAITHIILTHQDHDHVGAAAAFKRKYLHVKILASEEEAAYISGDRKSLRLEQAEQLQERLPEDMQEFGKSFIRLLQGVEPVEIDELLTENEVLPFCGGCQVISTPGHTPGHISLYLTEFNTIITGDAMVLEDGKPEIANPQFAFNLEQAKVSLQRLLDLPAQKIISYHGGIKEL